MEQPSDQCWFVFMKPGASAIDQDQSELDSQQALISQQIPDIQAPIVGAIAASQSEPFDNDHQNLIMRYDRRLRLTSKRVKQVF